MNYYNIFGIVISQFGFTYGSLSAYAHASLFNCYFGYGVWFIGLFFLFVEDKQEVKNG